MKRPRETIWIEEPKDYTAVVDGYSWRLWQVNTRGRYEMRSDNGRAVIFKRHELPSYSRTIWHLRVDDEILYKLNSPIRRHFQPYFHQVKAMQHAALIMKAKPAP